MRFVHFSLAVAAMVALVGCGTSEAPRQAVDAGSRGSVSAVDTDAPEASPLAVDNLPPGRCGLLLWTVNNRQPVLIYRSVVEAGADMVIDGQAMRLNQLRRGGAVQFGVGSSEEYVSPDGAVRATISIAYGDTFPSGIYVESGTIRLVNGLQWERIIPVAGIAGCRAA